ncbi:unnamed protein product [Rotaria sp. Silwood1]|nr:unnamed protein product [Rotaria sp. Silwood1]
MDETEENESSWNNTDDDNDEVGMENINELLQGLMNEMSSEANEQTAESSIIFEHLSSKFKQLHDDHDNPENLIHHTLPLCDELIDSIEEANFTETSDLQTCLEIMPLIGTIFENITSIKDEKFLIREFFFELLNLLSKPQICSCFNDNQHTKTPNIEVYKYLTILLLALATDLAGTVPFIQDDSVTRNYSNLLSAMYQRVKRDLQLGNHTKQQTALDDKITNCILSFFWNLSDRTIIVPWFLDIDLTKTMLECLKSENYRHQGTLHLHVSEPLAVFTKLFTDDHSLKYVLNDAETNPKLDVSLKINLFIDLFMKFRDAFEEKNQLEQFTCTALLNILWSISFQDEYEMNLKKNQDFMKAIRNIASYSSENSIEHYALRSMESVKKSANGILDNLYEIHDSKTNDIADQLLVSDTSNEKPMIMISYAHANNQFCDKILAEIEKKRRSISNLD